MVKEAQTLIVTTVPNNLDLLVGIKALESSLLPQLKAK
jgi:hypothetical protein